MNPIRLLLVDDHSVMRAGLANMLSSVPQFEVLGEADCCKTAIDMYARLRPDVVLLDIYMPDEDGLACLQQLKQIAADCSVLILSSSEVDADIQSVLSMGANGFVSKSADPSELIESIQAAHAGKIVLRKDIEERLRQSQAIHLTARELEVLRLLRQGYSNPDIGHCLGITPRTAKAHVAALINKLGAADRTQAVAIAFERGILRP